MEEKVKEIVRPFEYENSRLEGVISHQNLKITELKNSVAELQQNLKDFSKRFENCGRDEPMETVQDTLGSTAVFTCPICDILVGKHQKYCHMCGQKLLVEKEEYKDGLD